MIDNKNIEFTAQDRCDRCPAQAYVVYQKDGLELQFCLHHANAHNLALECSGWVALYDFAAIEKLVDNERVPA